MVRLIRVLSIALKKKTTAPGKAFVVKSEHGGSVVAETELYQQPGLASAPTKEDVGVEVRCVSGGRVIVATHNYRVEISLKDGETALFSTDASGNTIKSVIKLDQAGNVDLNGNSKRLVTWDELNSALQNHTHLAGALVAPSGPVTGTTGPPSGLDLSSAKTATIRTGG